MWTRGEVEFGGPLVVLLRWWCVLVCGGVWWWSGDLVGGVLENERENRRSALASQQCDYSRAIPDGHCTTMEGRFQSFPLL